MSIYSSINPPQGYYVYAYLRPDFSPYYIGKGKKFRAWDKVGRSLHLPPNRAKHIIIIQDNLSEIAAFILERYYIRWFGRKDNETGILRNLTDGGEGVAGHISPRKGSTLPEEWKAKMRKPKDLTEAQREANRLIKMGRVPPNKGISGYCYTSPDGQKFGSAQQAADAYGFKYKSTVFQRCVDPTSGWTKHKIT